MAEPATTAEPQLAQRFLRFAERECAGRSPLYQALAAGIARDPALLALAAGLPATQPPANLLFACVHHLMRREAPDHPLAAFYPSLSARARPAGEAFPAFRDFCLGRAEAVRALARRRRVATNEVRRSAVLALAFLEAARRSGATVWHQLEIGASAGLNLLWDRYALVFEPAGEEPVRLGPADSSLILRCTLGGASPPPFAVPFPATVSRLGLDLIPLDPGDPEDADWLRALVWPEQIERAARLDRALGIAAAAGPMVRAADGLAFLPGHADSLPPGETLCLYHCFTFNQIPKPEAARFEALLTEIGRARPVLRVAMEWGERDAPELRLTCYRGGDRESRLLALCDAHGAWVEWLAGGRGSSMTPSH